MTETIQVAGSRFPALSLQRYGSSDQVMVLLHGFPADGRLWREAAPLLASAFTVIVPDLPGTGGSVLPDGDLTVEDQAQVVRTLLDELGIAKVILAGHSMGGYASLAFAEMWPERLAGLALVHSTAKADTEEKKEQRRKTIALIQKGGRETFIRQMIPGLFSSFTKERRPDLVQEQIMMGSELPDEALVKFYEAMMKREDRTKILENAGFPVQWIFGKEDALLPLPQVLQQTSLTDVSFVSVYENAGHMSMLEQPGQLAADLKQFGQYCFNH